MSYSEKDTIASSKPLRVGVVIDLQWQPEAGGHVKCWERFAEAAVQLPDQVDLTLNFLGDRERTIELAPNVRYLLHRPRFSTQRLPFLNNVADHTDLAKRNPALLPSMARYDVLHATHPPFTLSNTALYHARRTGTPLVCSVHTVTPNYTRVFTAQVIRQLLGNGRLSHWLLDYWQLDQRQATAMKKKIADFWAQCNWVLVSQPEDKIDAAQVVPGNHISHLRRGIDKDLFHPRQRDRERLEQTFGIPSNRFVLLFVGRIDPGKNIMMFAELIHKLRDMTLPVHALIVGSGAAENEVKTLLGDSVTLAGELPQSSLAWVYASADLFVFPSPFETYGNVVVEAKASGLPALVPQVGGASQLIKTAGSDGWCLDHTQFETWVSTIASLLQNPAHLEQMRIAARAHIETDWPSWKDVLVQDLLPVWQQVAGTTSS